MFIRLFRSLLIRFIHLIIIPAILRFLMTSIIIFLLLRRLCVCAGVYIYFRVYTLCIQHVYVFVLEYAHYFIILGILIHLIPFLILPLLLHRLCVCAGVYILSCVWAVH